MNILFLYVARPECKRRNHVLPQLFGLCFVQQIHFIMFNTVFFQLIHSSSMTSVSYFCFVCDFPLHSSRSFLNSRNIAFTEMSKKSQLHGVFSRLPPFLISSSSFDILSILLSIFSHLCKHSLISVEAQWPSV